MYANVELQGKVIPDALVVPTEAVIRSGARTLAFRRTGGPAPSSRARSGSAKKAGRATPTCGCSPGCSDDDEVVTSAQFMLDSESRLQEAIQ